MGEEANPHPGSDRSCNVSVETMEITPHAALFGIMDIFGSYVQSLDTDAVPESSMSISPPQQVGRPASDSIIVAD